MKCAIPTGDAPSLRPLQEPALSLSKGWAAMLPAQLFSVLHHPLRMPSSYPPFAEYCLVPIHPLQFVPGTNCKGCPGAEQEYAKNGAPAAAVAFAAWRPGHPHDSLRNCASFKGRATRQREGHPS